MMASMARKHTGGHASGERGQALLELMPVVVLMLTLTFGVIDFGRLIWQQELITALTREGSDVASRAPDTDTLTQALTLGLNAVTSDGAALNLTGSCAAKVTAPECGEVIITAVQNTLVLGVPTFVMTGQVTAGSLGAQSRIGPYSSKNTQKQNTVTLSAQSLPGVTVKLPQPGNTIYITEVFDKYSPITPLGAFVKFTMPSNVTLYDVAYF
jgi:Flp pilus assembly protein TadG